MPEVLFWNNVQRYYGGNVEAMARYRMIRDSGNCPFCDPNITCQLVLQTEYWRVVYNEFPCADSRLHLLLLPKRHVVRVRDLTAEEWRDFPEALWRLTDSETYEGCPLALEHGYSLATFRSEEASGATIRHLHGHIIRPDYGKVVSFPIG